MYLCIIYNINTRIMYTTTPCAKINLGLNITEKRTDGYHNLETVFYPVPVFDKIMITPNGTPPCTCTLSIEGTPVDGDTQNNLVAKAYRKLCERKPLPGVDIRLNKNIPMQAGMGGGSADCAFTLVALNRMFHMGISEAELQRMAASLGADCAFFVKSQPCFATGIGDIMQSVNLNLDSYWMLMVKPPVSVSTKEAFSGITPRKPQRQCRDIVENEPVEKWKELLVNDFEESIFAIHPELAAIKQHIYNLGAEYAAMSGSGSALFGLFSHKPEIPDTETFKTNKCRIELFSMAGIREMFPIVNEEGETIGCTTRAYAHSGAKPLHPVVHLHVFNERGELYLQKRPEWKDIQPGKWDTAVGGHIDMDETVEEALLRETREELGISGFCPEALGKYVFESKVEKELVNVFRTYFNAPLHPSKTELDGGRFFSPEEIAQRMGKGFFTPNFENEYTKVLQRL